MFKTVSKHAHLEIQKHQIKIVFDKQERKPSISIEIIKLPSKFNKF